MSPRPERAAAPDPGLRSFSRSLPMGLLRAREAVMSAFRPHLHDLGITEQQWRVLRALQGEGELSPSELAQTTCISQPSLSRIVPALAARSLLERHLDPADRRSWRLRLSADGERLLARGAARSEAIYEDIETRFGPERMALLHELLDHLTDRLTGKPGQ